MDVIDFPSPNHGPRRGVTAPNMIVLHYTGMSAAALALARLCNPSAEVSAHYLIDECGKCYRLVSEAMRAWHAGEAAWGPVTDINSHSIGIELSNPGHEAGCPPFPEAQMEALEELLFSIRLRWSIPLERVLGHSDVAVGRKIDPGEAFDWRRLAARGLAVTSQAGAEAAPPGPAEAAIAMGAVRLGYQMPAGESGWSDLLRALQMRLAPEETGRPASPLLAARVADLAARFPAPATDRPGHGYGAAMAAQQGGGLRSPPPPGRDFGRDFDLDTE